MNIVPSRKKVVATEDYAPNVKLAEERLGPLAVKVTDVALTRDGQMPFESGEFDPSKAPKSLKSGAHIDVIVDRVEHHGLFVQVAGVLGRRGRGYISNRDLGEVEGFKIRIQGFTVPGQPKYKRMRRYVLQGADAVALVDGEEATLKRLEQRPNEVVLHPANSSLSAMHFNPEQVQIQGVLVGQMRRYH